LPMQGRRPLRWARSARSDPLVRGSVHIDVHARRLGAHHLQHALLVDLREQRRGRARKGALPPLVHRRRPRRYSRADHRDAPLGLGAGREHPEHRRKRGDCRGARGLPGVAAERSRPDGDLLHPHLLPGAACGRLPGVLVRVPALAGRLLTCSTTGRRRRRLLRPHRWLPLRGADRPARGGASTAPAGLLMIGFEEHVQVALDALPPDLAAGLKNVAVIVEEENPDEPDIFGLFEEAPYLPAKVTVYRRPLEEDFGDDPEELERQIRITVLHELAHYFGIDEERLEELGYQ